MTEQNQTKQLDTGQKEGFKLKPKKTGLTALLEQEEASKREAQALQALTKVNTKSVEQLERERSGYTDPHSEAVKDRIAIIFDDSGSMGGQKIADAHNGTIEFLRNCQVNQVAVAIYPMNAAPLTLETNLPRIAALIPFIKATGGTPLFETWTEAQKEKELGFTRMIIFSDGQPNGLNNKESCIEKAISAKTPIDTVYIAQGFRDDSELLQEIAERTGGFYLKFDRNKVNFRDAFKYLSPGLRHQLTDGDFRRNLEEGKIK